MRRRSSGSAGIDGVGRGCPAERFAAALNEQVGREFAAADQYVSIGTHYEDQDVPRLAKFFYAQADEERGHAMKMVQYMLATNCPVELGTVAAPKNHFRGHIDPIKLALEQEREVTVHISELFEIARETKDYQSEQFVEWFLEEQVEEESTMEDLLAIAERTREIPMLRRNTLPANMPATDPSRTM